MKIIFVLLSICLSSISFAQFNPAIQKEILVWSYYDQGNALLDTEEYRQAIDAYSLAVQLDPNFALAYYNRGNAYILFSEYNSLAFENNLRSLALEDYLKALALDPTLSRAPLPNIRVVYGKLIDCVVEGFFHFKKSDQANNTPEGMLEIRFSKEVLFSKIYNHLAKPSVTGQNSNPCNESDINAFMFWSCIAAYAAKFIEESKKNRDICVDIPYTGAAKTTL